MSNFIDSPIIVNQTKDEFYKQPMFYAIGHFSKFISRGSKRIKLTQTSIVKSVGFKRPDGAIVIVLYNRYNKYHCLQKLYTLIFYIQVKCIYIV